jgi:hypothetical protein
MIELIQRAFPNSSFAAESIDRADRSHQLLVNRIVETIGAGNVPAFQLFIIGRFKGIDASGMAARQPRTPDHANGPRSLGLLLSWAADFARWRAGCAQR